MGKNKKRKASLGSSESTKVKEECATNDHELKLNTDAKNNPLYEEQQSFLSSLTQKEREHYFSPSHIDSERRGELWMNQADIGEDLVNRYAWATPTKECLAIFREFSPIVEIGSGSNAYWAKYMKQMGGIDVVAYDRNVQEGGKITHDAKATNSSKNKRKRSKSDEIVSESVELVVRRGGPEVLKSSKTKDKTLFLCYPDEEDFPAERPDDSSGDYSIEAADQSPLSFGWQCLNEYKGNYVIHVGELAFFDATLNMEQSPWGRSSSSEFQQRLASEFHCIAKIQLPNWLHVRDSISVWKRSEICQMAFVGEDDDDESEEIIEYRHIPPDEMLPTKIIAPCMAHLFAPSVSVKEGKQKAEAETIPSKNATKRNEKKIESKPDDGDKPVPTGATQSDTNSKKSKSGRRRERQKQKKLLSKQASPDKEKSATEQKKIRSEYFRLHGRLPPPS